MAAGDPASRQEEPAATCPACGTAQPAGALFCFRCGAALQAARCSSCGAELLAAAGLLLDAGRDREAADLAQQAREVFGRIGATVWLAALRP